MAEPRFYRKWYNQRFKSFTLSYRETDLLVRVPCKLADVEIDELKRDCLLYIQELRDRLDGFIEDYPEFKDSLVPVELPEDAPLEARLMANSARLAGVGPLAAVAGFFAEMVGRMVLNKTDEVIVENGGDIFLALKEAGLVGVYAGPDSPFTGKVGLKIPAETTPLGVCTSAGTVGPSFSLGRADAVIALSKSTSLADAAATALGNLIKTEGDIEEALKKSQTIAGITGTVIIVGQQLGARGEVEFIRLTGQDKRPLTGP